MARWLAWPIVPSMPCTTAHTVQGGKGSSRHTLIDLMLPLTPSPKESLNRLQVSLGTRGGQEEPCGAGQGCESQAGVTSHGQGCT